LFWPAVVSLFENFSGIWNILEVPRNFKF